VWYKIVAVLRLMQSEVCQLQPGVNRFTLLSNHYPILSLCHTSLKCFNYSGKPKINPYNYLGLLYFWPSHRASLFTVSFFTTSLFALLIFIAFLTAVHNHPHLDYPLPTTNDYKLSAARTNIIKLIIYNNFMNFLKDIFQI